LSLTNLRLGLWSKCLFVLVLWAGVVRAEVNPGGNGNSQVLREYIEYRWLSGGPEQMVDMFEQKLLWSALQAIELARKAPLQEVDRKTIREGIQLRRVQANVSKPDPVAMGVQYNLFANCLEENLNSALDANGLEELVSYINTGFYRRLPKLRIPLEGWFPLAFQKQRGGGTQLTAEQAKSIFKGDLARVVELANLVNVYVFISDAWDQLATIEESLGRETYLAVLRELLFMSADLPGLLSEQGLSNQEIQWLQVISESNHFKVERRAFLYCQRSRNFYTNEFERYVRGFKAAMDAYLQANPKYASP
jgi:hypothetical protein